MFFPYLAALDSIEPFFFPHWIRVFVTNESNSVQLADKAEQMFLRRRRRQRKPQKHFFLYYCNCNRYTSHQWRNHTATNICGNVSTLFDFPPSLGLHRFVFARRASALIFFSFSSLEVEDALPLISSHKKEQMFIEKLLWNYNYNTFFCHANLGGCQKRKGKNLFDRLHHQSAFVSCS